MSLTIDLPTRGLRDFLLEQEPGTRVLVIEGRSRETRARLDSLLAITPVDVIKQVRRPNSGESLTLANGTTVNFRHATGPDGLRGRGMAVDALVITEAGRREISERRFDLGPLLATGPVVAYL